MKTILSMLLLVLPFGAGCAGAPDSGDAADLFLEGDGKEDSSGVQHVQLVRLNDLNQTFMFDLPGKQQVAFVMPGTRGVAFQVVVTDESDSILDFDHLRMTVLVGTSPDGAGARQIGTAGSYWGGPMTDIKSAQDGEWYFLVLRNRSTPNHHAGFISDVYGATAYHRQETVGLGESCGRSTRTWGFGRATFTLGGLVGDTTYEVNAAGASASDDAGLEVFELDEASPGSAFDNFKWPGGAYAPVQRVASATGVGTVATRFTARAGMRYAVAPHLSGSDVDLGLCADGGGCAPACR